MAAKARNRAGVQGRSFTTCRRPGFRHNRRGFPGGPGRHGGAAAEANPRSRAVSRARRSWRNPASRRPACQSRPDDGRRRNTAVRGAVSGRDLHEAVMSGCDRARGDRSVKIFLVLAFALAMQPRRRQSKRSRRPRRPTSVAITQRRCVVFGHSPNRETPTLSSSSGSCTTTARASRRTTPGRRSGIAAPPNRDSPGLGSRSRSSAPSAWAFPGTTFRRRCGPARQRPGWSTRNAWHAKQLGHFKFEARHAGIGASACVEMRPSDADVAWR